MAITTDWSSATLSPGFSFLIPKEIDVFTSRSNDPTDIDVFITHWYLRGRAMAGIRRTSLNYLDVPVPFRPPSSVGATTAAHAKWLKMLAEAETLVADDKFLQYMAEVRGMCLKERTAPPEVIGRFYARYTAMVNNLYDAYMQNVHLQRADYIKEILNIFIQRLFELRNELRNILLTDYIYINEALIQNGKTPFDMDIVIPCLITKELRHDSLEDLLRQMWLSAMRRKKSPPTKKVPKVSNVFDTPRHSKESRRSDKDIEDLEDIFENEEEELPVINPTYANTLLIQRMVRYSKFRLEENSFNFLKYMNPNKLLPSTRIEMAAAEYIKKVYRHFMFLKREHLKRYKRDVLMHFEHDPDRPKRLFQEETDKLYDLLNNIKKKLQPQFFEAFEKEKARLIFLKRDNIMEDITEHVRQWFYDWYYGYGKFPEFPTKLEKGTLLVVRGDFVTVEEQLANDEAYFKATKGKTADQIKHEKQQEKKDLERKAEEAKVKEKSRANKLFKMRFSPLTDPGYMPCQSKLKDPLTKALRDYRLAWSFWDEMPEITDTIFGYMKSLLTEEVLCTMHVECRAIVDELMREELKILLREQQKMYKRLGWHFPKIKIKTDRKQKLMSRSLAGMDDNIMKKLAPLFDVDGAITKPETKLKDVVGDYNYIAYDLLVKDPDAKFERPAYGDVKNRIHYSCVLGSGIQPGADRNKSVLLLGPEKSGKSFLVDAVAGEIHAVKINLTPELHSAGDINALELCTLALIAAKLFQPTVIYIRNIEKLFARKVPPEEVILRAKSYIGPLKNLLKAINVQDNIIFIATCSNPRVAKTKQMLPIFNDIILVPRADYGSIQLFLKEKFRKNIGIPYDHLTQPYANMMKNFGFGNVVRVYNEVMTSERILKLGITPLSPVEFLEVIEREKLKPIPDEEYKIYEDFFIKSTILHEKRIQFAEINDKRAKVYEGIRKNKLEQEKGKKSKPGSDGDEELPSE